MTENPQQHNGTCILMVDDDRFLLDMYSMKFEQAGFDVHACFSVEEALGELRGGLKPRVILFDMLMPGQDGLALARTVEGEKLAPGATLVALTNQASDADKSEAAKLGVEHYIVKASMIPSEVVETVSKL